MNTLIDFVIDHWKLSESDNFQIAVEEQRAETAVEIAVTGEAEAPFTIQAARPPRVGKRATVALALSESCSCIGVRFDF